MAHTHVEEFRVKPQPRVAAFRERELHRTHNMLVVTIISSAMIIVVAALFMTMF